MAKTTARTNPSRSEKKNGAGSMPRAKASERAGRAAVAALEGASGAAAKTGALGGATGAVDRADRVDAGRAMRKEVPRSSHGDWQPAADRPDPVAVLVAQGESRVPELLPIRYGGWRSRPSVSFAVRRRAWPPIWRRLRARGSWCSCAATGIW